MTNKNPNKIRSLAINLNTPPHYEVYADNAEFADVMNATIAIAKIAVVIATCNMSNQQLNSVTPLLA